MSEIISFLNEDFRPDRNGSWLLGEQGEALAAEHLEKNGYRLVMANFKVPVGRNSRGAEVTGEIDLIALDGDVLCFIEVKTRASAGFASPLANVGLRKQRQITRTARVYRTIFNVSRVPYRYDAVSVLLPAGRKPEIEIFKGFWNESKFRKRSWNRGEFV